MPYTLQECDAAAAELDTKMDTIQVCVCVFKVLKLYGDLKKSQVPASGIFSDLGLLIT